MPRFQDNCDLFCENCFCKLSCTRIAPVSCFISGTQLGNLHNKAVKCIVIGLWNDCSCK